MKVSEFLTYLKQRRNYSDLTIQSYESDLLQFESFLVNDDDGKMVLENDNLITVNAVRSWIITLTQQGLTARSVNRKISSLKAYFKWVEVNDADFKNPMLKIVSPKISQRKLVAITNSDIFNLLQQRPKEDDLECFRNYLIIEILYSTGIRQAELLKIEHQDISVKNKQLRVLGKGNKERVIPIGEKLMSDIMKYIELKYRFNISGNRLMTTKNGRQLSKYQLYSIVHKILEGVSVSVHSPHVFRHTCATHLVDNGANIVNVKNLLGHASLKATEVYTHTSIEQLKKEYRRSFEQEFN